MTSQNYTSWRKRLEFEEFLNTISHGIGAVAAIIGFVVLMVYAIYSPKNWSVFSVFFYGISLISAYVSSTFYHGVKI